MLTCKCWCETDVIFCLIQLLLNFCFVRLVLADHSLILSYRKQGAENLQLVLQNFLTPAEILGKPHGHQGHDLSQVVLQDISDHPVLVIEGNSTLKT